MSINLCFNAHAALSKIQFPSGYQQLMPYLILNNAQGFLDFMVNVFGAVEKMKHMRDENTILHGELLVGESVIMFADATAQFEQNTGGFFIYVNDTDATYKKAIEQRAQEIMPPADQPYGRSGGIKDPFGNTWWITTAPK